MEDYTEPEEPKCTLTPEEQAAIEGQILLIKNEANALLTNGNHVEALNKYQEAISLAESNNITYQLAILYRNRSIVFKKCVLD